MQRRDCRLAQTRYLAAGRQGQWEVAPHPWNVLKGLVAACFVAQGQTDRWQTVTTAYAQVKGYSTGSCKYRAAFRVLEELALFRIRHPDGKVVFGAAPAGRNACPNGITDHSSTTVYQGGDFFISGTWPVPVSVYFNNRKVPFQAGDPNDRCCHKGILPVEVPADLPLGKAQVSLRGDGNAFRLDGPTVTVLRPQSSP
ncbi:hypothetical protein [Streptomyces paromomycinus]|uniref:Uncharacterized protein n=1 Tax=Streptomyces paromomycinus TaxID=92743 RepID=A0A401VUG0_STREY|nr:hypothetical protein [Streptomyces paromomycinus]GCD40710.1 hypothetical protein GKJPGBOP_00363 [Streptomyces paromomycinus]